MLSQAKNAQQLASNPDASVWVTANAGTGKTKVLTERVLQLMLHGILPGKILCLTFTKVAAAEMAERIKNILAKWVTADEKVLSDSIETIIGKKPDKKMQSLARSLFATIIDDPSELKIKTIHSFCESLLKRFPLEAGVSPHFQVMDEQASNELIREAWLKILVKSEGGSEQNKKLRQAIINVAREVHETTLSTVINELIRERNKLQKCLSEYDGLQKTREALYARLGLKRNTTVSDVIKASCLRKNFNAENIKTLCRALTEGNDSDKIRGDKISSWLDMQERERETGFDEYKYIFLTKDEKPRKTSQIATKNVLNSLPEAEKIISAEQERLIEINEQIKSAVTAFLSESLLVIGNEVLEIYEELKRKHSSLDYSDLILISGKLLSYSQMSPWIMYKLDGGIDHILVDEAQDTSPEQWEIITSLCQEFFSGETAQEKTRTLFVVGDEKQSIFSFQGADPFIFEEKRQDIANTARQSQKLWRNISLDFSFRSTEPVLRAVDAIFSEEILRKSITSFASSVEHKIHRSKHAGRVELWPLFSSPEKEKNMESWPLPLEIKKPENPKALLAEHIALTIKTWLTENRILESRGRAISAGDIMILVRKRDDFVDLMISSLKKHGVSVAGSDRMVLTEHIAIMDLLALGKFLLLPEDDLTLATILKCPLLGISEEELFELAYNRGEKTLWQRLKEKSEEKDIFKSAFEYLSELLNKTDWHSPFWLYSHILSAIEGRKAFISRLGYEVNEALDEFLNSIISYESSHTPSLQGFLHWMNISEKQIKRDMEQNRDEVRIMTVHGAKGLEAPVIFLPDTSQIPDNRKKILIWDEAGFPLWPGKKSNGNKLYKKLDEKYSELVFDEYLRLFYVAMTRAEDELYICGWKNGNIPEKSWYNLARKSIKEIGEETAFPSKNTEENKAYTLTSKQQEKAEEKAVIRTIKSEKLKLPEFVFKLPEADKQPKIISPSKIISEEEQSVFSPLQTGIYERGKTIHTLLQFLPSIPIEKRNKAAEKFMERADAKYSTEEKNEIIKEVISVINSTEFSEVFSENSRAEVPVSGQVGNYLVSGQIDRLVVTENEVLIIDYKTNREPPVSKEKISRSYIVQMSAYQALLSQIYPDKKIRCALIWTAIPKLVELEEKMLTIDLSDQQP